jgi:hypothetical protein
LTGITVVVQPVLVSATKIAATLTPALRPHDGVIMITGIGDHLRPEWPITITGMRILGFDRRMIPAIGPAVCHMKRRRRLSRYPLPIRPRRGSFGYDPVVGNIS